MKQAVAALRQVDQAIVREQMRPNFVDEPELFERFFPMLCEFARFFNGGS